MKSQENNWKRKWYNIIFEHHTRKGRIFDEILLVLILLSVAVVFLDSMKVLRDQYHSLLLIMEWVFTIVFTIEYVLRVLVSPIRTKYIFSFFGIIDLLSIIPTYLSIFFFGSQYLIVIRVLRLLRVFRILKMVRFTSASIYLIHALKHSREKIVVFFGTVLIIVTIMGTIMYIIEGPEAGFDSIPKAIYWAIVTITTVGFGDITPTTGLGQMIASLLMLTGYAIIAVPTGIITSEMTRERKHTPLKSKTCQHCEDITYASNAVYCKVCGKPIEDSIE